MTRSRPRLSRPRPAGFGLFVGVLRSLVLVVLGAGYLVPALHFGLVQHELCAEHGELRHTSGHALEIARPAAERAPAADPVPAFADEHEHCAVVATSSADNAPISPRALSVTPVTEASPSQFPRAEFAHVSLALLHYAPKLAPPPVSTLT